MLSTILRSSTSNLNSLGSSVPVELPLRRVAKSMRPVGAQSRLTTPWYAVCFSSLHLLKVSTWGKYVSTLAIFFSLSLSWPPHRNLSGGWVGPRCGVLPFGTEHDQ